MDRYLFNFGPEVILVHPGLLDTPPVTAGGGGGAGGAADATADTPDTPDTPDAPNTGLIGAGISAVVTLAKAYFTSKQMKQAGEAHREELAHNTAVKNNEASRDAAIEIGRISNSGPWNRGGGGSSLT